jgi:hypothetical protein
MSETNDFPLCAGEFGHHPPRKFAVAGLRHLIH